MLFIMVKKQLRTTKNIVAIMAIVSLVSLSAQNAEAFSEEILLDPVSCENFLRGIWDNDSTTCTVVSFVSSEGTKLVIPSDVTLKIIGLFENNDAIIIEESGTITVNGWGQNNNGLLNNYGVIKNDGNFNCERCGFINFNTVINTGVIENGHRINNQDTFINEGIINNSGEILNRDTFITCLGEVNGTPTRGNPNWDIC